MLISLMKQFHQSGNFSQSVTLPFSFLGKFLEDAVVQTYFEQLILRRFYRNDLASIAPSRRWSV